MLHFKCGASTTLPASPKPAPAFGSHTVTTNLPIFYDCEASSLAGFPIEVGWAYVDVPSMQIKSEAYLIRPPDHWWSKSIWDPEAEKLHKIPPQTLFQDGHPPREVAGRMNEALRDRQLYSDNPAYDEPWLRSVFVEAGLLPAFALKKTSALVILERLARSRGIDSQIFQRIKAAADQTSRTGIGRARRPLSRRPVEAHVLVQW